jgi:hypothetical protein
MGQTLRILRGTDLAQNKSAKLAHHRKDSDEKPRHTTESQLAYVLSPNCSRENGPGRLQVKDNKGPCYLSRVDHDNMITSRKQTTDIGNYPFANMTTSVLPSVLQLLVTANVGPSLLILSTLMMVVIHSS